MPGCKPIDGDIVVDLDHPQSTGLVCGSPRIRNGVTGVWVEWDISAWAADFEPSHYTRIGRVISTKAQRGADEQAGRRADEAARAARLAHVDGVRQSVEPALAHMATHRRRPPGSMCHTYHPIEGITLRKQGRWTEVIVAGYVVGHAVWSPGPEMGYSGDCRLCGHLRLFDAATEGSALNGVQAHLLSSHIIADTTKHWLLPCTLPIKAD